MPLPIRAVLEVPMADVLSKAPGALCSECPLQDCPPVFGSGPENPRLAVVGEAPGKDEVDQGKPFIGRSGQLLEKVVEYHGLKREDIWFTNACLCRPPNNETPSTKAVKACRPRLVQELLSRHPDTVLALGATAAKTCLATSDTISYLRAQPPTFSEELGARVICSYHPAAILYEKGHDLFPSLLKDVGKVTRIEVGWEPTKFRVYDDVESARRTLGELQLLREVTLDVEVDYEEGWPNDPHRADFLCMAISHRPGASVVFTKEVCDDPRFYKRLNELFVNGPKFAFQLGKFDIQRLWTLGVHSARVDNDTCYAHLVTDERKGTHDLEQLAVEILGAPRYKTDTRQWLPHKGASLKHLPPHILWEYNAADADVTHRLLAPLRKEMGSDGVSNLYHNLLIPGANVLAHVEYAGVGIDHERLTRLAGEFEADLIAREGDLAQWVENPRSPKQILAALHDLGYEVESTNKLTIKGIDEDFTRGILDYRGVQKLLSVYVKGLLARAVGDRIYTRFEIHNTETGRLASRNPNFQNIPIGSTIRDGIVAPEGYVFLSCDYAAIELRCLAVLADDPYLMQAFREGRNIHKETAPVLFGPNYTEQDYVWTKNTRFGSVYGGEAKYLAALYDIPPDVVVRLQSEMHRQSPNIRKYWRAIEKEIRTQGYLRSPTGQLRRFWYVTWDNWKDIRKEGYAFKPQNWASHLTLASLIKLEPMLREVARPIITVHDNLVFEVKEEYLADVARTVKTVMEDTGLPIPTPIELKVGKRWGSLKEYAA